MDPVVLDVSAENISRINAAVDQILEQWPDKDTDAVTRLFIYLVDKTLAGEDKSINAYAIAIDVLGRPESFDPVTNSAVRVTMHRLRSRLAYHFNASTTHEIEIRIPKGHYTVEFVQVAEFTQVTQADTSKEGQITDKDDIPPEEASSETKSSTSAPALARLHQQSKLKLAAGSIALVSIFFIALVSTGVIDFFSSPIGPCRDDLPTIKYSVQDDSPAAGPYFSDAVISRIQRAGASYPFVFFTDGTQCSDDQVEFALNITKIPTTDGYKVTAELAELYESTRPVIIWSREFAWTSQYSDQDVDDMVSAITYGTSSEDGIVPLSANKDNFVWTEEKYRDRYNCMYGAWRAIPHAEDDVYAGYADCISEYYTDDDPDGTVAAIYANLLQHEQFGFFEKRLSGGDIDLKAALNKADAINPMNKLLAQAKLREIREGRRGSANSEETAEYLDFVEKNHPFEPRLQGTTTRMQGEYLGQWDEAPEEFARLDNIIGTPDMFPFSLLSMHLALHENEEAWSIAQLAHPAVRPIYEIRVAAAAHFYGDDRLLQEAKDVLYRNGIRNYETARALVLNANYHTSLESRLLEAIENIMPKNSPDQTSDVNNTRPS